MQQRGSELRKNGGSKKVETTKRKGDGDTVKTKDKKKKKKKKKKKEKEVRLGKRT